MFMSGVNSDDNLSLFNTTQDAQSPKHDYSCASPMSSLEPVGRGPSAVRPDAIKLAAIMPRQAGWVAG